MLWYYYLTGIFHLFLMMQIIILIWWKWMGMLKSLLIKQLCYGATNLKFSSVPGTPLVISWHQGMFLKVKLKWFSKSILLKYWVFYKYIASGFCCCLFVVILPCKSLFLHEVMLEFLNYSLRSDFGIPKMETEKNTGNGNAW